MGISSLDQEHLERLVEVYKAIADPARIRILSLLASERRNGREIAKALSLSEPTITHHMAVLKRVGLVTVEKVGTSHIYSSDFRPVMAVNAFFQTKEAAAPSNEAQKVWNDFSENGKLKALPVQYKKRMYIIDRLARLFEEGRQYTEKEVNAILMDYYPDYATLRRELVESGYLARQRDVYWVPQAKD